MTKVLALIFSLISLFFIFTNDYLYVFLENINTSGFMGGFETIPCMILIFINYIALLTFVIFAFVSWLYTLKENDKNNKTSNAPFIVYIFAIIIFIISEILAFSQNDFIFEILAKKHIKEKYNITAQVVNIDSDKYKKTVYMKKMSISLKLLLKIKQEEKKYFLIVTN